MQRETKQHGKVHLGFWSLKGPRRRCRTGCWDGVAVCCVLRAVLTQAQSPAARGPRSSPCSLCPVVSSCSPKAAPGEREREGEGTGVA